MYPSYIFCHAVYNDVKVNLVPTPLQKGRCKGLLIFCVMNEDLDAAQINEKMCANARQHNQTDIV